MPARTQGILLALSAMFLYCLGDAALKQAVGIVSIFTALALFNGVGFGLNLATLAVRRISPRPHSLRFVLVYGALFTGEMLAFATALARMPFAETFVIILLTPMALAVAARCILGEQRTPVQYLCLLAGIVGVALMLFGPAIRTNQLTFHLDTVGVAAAVANIVFNTAKMIWLRRFGEPENSAVTGTWQLGMTTLAVLPFASFAGLDTGLVIAIAAGGILGFAGNLMYIQAFKLAEASQIAPTQLSQMVWITILGLVLFGEVPGPYTLSGAVIVVIAGLVFYQPHIFSRRA